VKPRQKNFRCGTVLLVTVPLATQCETAVARQQASHRTGRTDPTLPRAGPTDIPTLRLLGRTPGVGHAEARGPRRLGRRQGHRLVALVGCQRRGNDLPLEFKRRNYRPDEADDLVLTVTTNRATEKSLVRLLKNSS